MPPTCCYGMESGVGDRPRMAGLRLAARRGSVPRGSGRAATAAWRREIMTRLLSQRRPAACVLAGMLALVLATAGRSAAQDYGPADVRRELERTDDVLRRAHEMLQAAPPMPRAQDLLQTADRTQLGAWERFRAGQYVMALGATRDARRIAFMVVDLIRQRVSPGPGPIDLEPRAQHALENAQRAVDRAVECAGDPPSALAQRVLDLARTRLEEAQQAFREQKYALTVEICQQVGRMLEDLCAGPRRENVEQMIDSVDRLLQRAAPAVAAAGNPNATSMIEQARELLTRAEEHAAAREPRIAMRLARQARELTLQALRLSEVPPDPESVAQLLEDATHDFEGLGEAVHAS